MGLVIHSILYGVLFPLLTTAILYFVVLRLARTRLSWLGWVGGALILTQFLIVGLQGQVLILPAIFVPFWIAMTFFLLEDGAESPTTDDLAQAQILPEQQVVSRQENTAPNASDAANGSDERSSKLLPSSMHWWGGLFVAGAYLVGHVGLIGRSTFQSSELTMRLSLLVPLLVLLPSGRRGYKGAQWLQPLFYLLLLLPIFGFVFYPMLTAETWKTSQTILYVAAMACGTGLLWFLLHRVVASLSEASATWLMMLLGIGASVLFALSGSAKYAQLFGAMTAGLGIWWFLSLIRGRYEQPLGAAIGAVPVFAVLFSGYGYTSFLITDFSLTSALLLASAIPLLWIAHQSLPSLKAWKRTLLLSLALMTPVLIAIGLLVAKELSAPKEKKDDPYNYYNALPSQQAEHLKQKPLRLLVVVPTHNPSSAPFLPSQL